ncbi:Acyl-ACP thioesterase [Lachnospiraceae bacterium XBB1006]|nr:Acyl-ACP thioesterase [Lachnospiraceae bacterium XBB1006]
MYTFQSRVRYSEVASGNQLSVPGIVNYFQDCSTFQSEDLGKGLEWLNAHHRCWVVNSWRIKVLRYPVMGETILIGTWPHAMRGMFGERNFVIRDLEGHDLVIAESLWTYMDTMAKRPVKVEEDVLCAYQLEEAMDVAFKGRKIPVPEEMVECSPIYVANNLLDTNGHVNNGKYIMLAMQYVPTDFVITEFRVEYKRSALPGETMVPYIGITQNRVVVVFRAEGEQIDTIVEFERGTIC